MAVVLACQKLVVFADVRFGDVVVLQMRTVIEPEDLGGRLATFLQKDADHVDRQGTDVQRSVDRLAQFLRRMAFQEPQDLDEFAPTFAA